jgi:hypothetical protein
VINRENVVRAVFQLILLGALATPADALSFEVLGYAGELGEWELTATVTEKVRNQANEYSGQLMMKHVGICTQDGPEEKSGEIRIQISQASRMSATLSFDGVECTYAGQLSDAYKGAMRCPDRRAVPLIIWLK